MTRNLVAAALVVVALSVSTLSAAPQSTPKKSDAQVESLVVPVSFPGGITYSPKKWADAFEESLDEYLKDGWTLHSWNFIPNTAGVLVVFTRAK